MQNRLLILGSLREFVQLIQMARSRGIYTIVCDGYHGSIGKQYADKAYDIDVGDTDAIVRLCKEEKVDGITTSFSDYLFECMVKIAAKAELKCYFPLEKLDYYRDKNKMKEMFCKLDIPSAKHVHLQECFKEEELEGLSYPVVVKPLDKYGSRGILVLSSAEEIREHFSFICATSNRKEILVEEYNTGYEFNMMSWIIDGQVRVISIADREKTSIGLNEIPISTRNVYPSRLMDHVYEEARGILQKIADFTGQTEGILSMQFFWSLGKKVSVCEVAGRFFGYEHELVDFCSGLKVESLLLDYLYDEPALRRSLLGHSPFFDKTSAVLYFHGKPGMTVGNLDAAQKLSSYPGVKDAWLFYRPQESITMHGANPYAARFYLAGKSRREIDAMSTALIHDMSIKDAEGKECLYPNQLTQYPKI